MQFNEEVAPAHRTASPEESHAKLSDVLKLAVKVLGMELQWMIGFPIRRIQRIGLRRKIRQYERWIAQSKMQSCQGRRLSGSRVRRK